MHSAIHPAYDAVINAMRTGTAQQAKLAVDNFEKQAKAWAAFGQAVEQSINVEALLQSVPTDLGDRYAAAMQPIYDQVLASLVAGPGALALAQAQQFARLSAVWATLGPATTQGLAVGEALQVVPTDLGERFDAAMQPIYAKILASLVAGNATIAAAQIDMYNRLTAVWATLGQATTGAIDVEALLPEDLSAKFRARMEPEYEAIIAALVAGNAAVAAALLDRFNAQLAAWASLGQTITKITTEIADLGDPSTAIANWQLVSAQLERTAARAKTAFDAAIASGDVERIAKASVAYHDAVLARLQAEREMVANIEAAIQAILTQAATLVATVTQIATLDIGTGALGTVNALLGALEGMATSGPPAARQLWAVGQAIQAIIAVLPAAIAQFGALQTATDWLRYGVQTAAQLQAIGPNQISRAVVTGAAPFLAVQ